MAADITASLRAIDPVDPVRFDFSICHVGMMGSCGFRTKQARHAVPAARILPAAAGGDSQCTMHDVNLPM